MFISTGAFHSNPEIHVHNYATFKDEKPLTENIKGSTGEVAGGATA
jgi:hypothetical protein